MSKIFEFLKFLCLKLFYLPKMEGTARAIEWQFNSSPSRLLRFIKAMIWSMTPSTLVRMLFRMSCGTSTPVAPLPVGAVFIARLSESTSNWHNIDTISRVLGKDESCKKGV
jgi:hypothetical protein